MSYNDQYYICLSGYSAGSKHVIKPDLSTSSRDYYFKKPIVGEAPFVFLNARKDEDVKACNVWPLTDVMNVGADLLVGEELCQKILKFPIDGVCLHPSIYIDDEDKWHDKYRFLTFFETLDCWDRNQSLIDVDERTLSSGIVLPAEVDKYYLDSTVLDCVAEEKRLLFKMGGASVEYIFAHKKIIDLFELADSVSVRFVKVADFVEGDQFRP